MGSFLSSLIGGGPLAEAAELPAGDSRVVAFHSSNRWQLHFDSLKNSNQLLVVDFAAAWCGPCKFMEPAVNAMANEFTDVAFAKIDVDELQSANPVMPMDDNSTADTLLIHKLIVICYIRAVSEVPKSLRFLIHGAVAPDVSREFSVQAMPTFVLLQQGNEVDRVVGAKKDELQKKIAKYRAKSL